MNEKSSLPQLISANDSRLDILLGGYELIDNIEEALEDLFKIDFPFIVPGSPEYKKTHAIYLKKIGDPKKYGVWVIFTWKGMAVHLPTEEDYFKLRTARNKFLINEKEQNEFYASRIGIAGLSVGSSIFNAITLSGGGKNMRVADNDTMAIVNLNRLFSSVCDLGTNKALAAAKRVYEINPFQKIKIFENGITEENMDEFFGEGDDLLQLFIEEMDDIKLKIDTRFKARKLRIPVIMATDNGDNSIIDVERFDLEPNRPLFHGSVSEKILSETPANPTMAEKVKLANSIVGPDVTPRTRLSLTLVGSKLPAWPQLGNAANLSGVVASYVARRILTNEDMPSGRYEVNLDSLIDPNYHNTRSVQVRDGQKKEFIKGFELLFGE